MERTKKRVKSEEQDKDKRSKVYDLSLEILYKINEYLSMQDRYQLSLLDHHFYKIFIPLMYKHIEWQNDYDVKKLNIIKYGKYIQSIDLSYAISLDDKASILHQLHKQFPKKMYQIINTRFKRILRYVFTHDNERLHSNYVINHLKVLLWNRDHFTHCFFNPCKMQWEKKNAHLIKKLNLDFIGIARNIDNNFINDFQLLCGLEFITISYSNTRLQNLMESSISSFKNLSNLQIIYKDGDYDVSTILNATYANLTRLTLKVEEYYALNVTNAQSIYLNSINFPKLKYIDIDLPLTPIIFKGLFENLTQFIYSIDSLTTCYKFDPSCFPKLNLLRLSGTKSLMSYDISPTIDVLDNTLVMLDVCSGNKLENLNTIQLGTVELNLNFIRFLSRACPNLNQLYLNECNFPDNIEYSHIQSFESTFSIKTFIMQGDEDYVFYKLFIENSPRLKYIFAEDVEYAHKLINDANISLFSIDECNSLPCFKFFEFK